MYELTIVRPNQTTERRTVTTGGEIRIAVWDLISSRGFEIKDEHHADLIAQAGAARDKADIDGYAALVFDGIGALTLTAA